MEDSPISHNDTAEAVDYAINIPFLHRKEAERLGITKDSLKEITDRSRDAVCTLFGITHTQLSETFQRIGTAWKEPFLTLSDEPIMAWKKGRNIFVSLSQYAEHGSKRVGSPDESLESLVRHELAHSAAETAYSKLKRKRLEFDRSDEHAFLMELPALAAEGKFDQELNGKDNTLTPYTMFDLYSNLLRDVKKDKRGIQQPSMKQFALWLLEKKGADKVCGAIAYGKISEAFDQEFGGQPLQLWHEMAKDMGYDDEEMRTMEWMGEQAFRYDELMRDVLPDGEIVPNPDMWKQNEYGQDISIPKWYAELEHDTRFTTAAGYLLGKNKEPYFIAFDGESRQVYVSHAVGGANHIESGLRKFDSVDDAFGEEGYIL